MWLSIISLKRWNVPIIHCGCTEKDCGFAKSWEINFSPPDKFNSMEILPLNELQQKCQYFLINYQIYFRIAQPCL